ncbi:MULTISPECIES: malate dehydrogenase [unclassified Methylophaga]|uniref:malate dehydrogenase n=2 Tax=unclassified Methylophaga TaxID=2629249 RepID=UPI00259CA6E5|nr:MULTISPECIES: malate dehydrogenase [unclassified Methylophaga]
MKHKIALYGAGNVGATTAQWLAQKELGDIVLFDINESLAEGKALDLMQAGPAAGFDCSILGSDNPDIIADADIVVVSAGVPRRKNPQTGKYPGRDELIKINQAVIEQASAHIKNLAPDAIVIMVTNPIEAMCHVVKQITGFPSERIIGQAGALDTTRYKTFIAMELGVSVKDVNGMVIGGHGDAMVPLPTHTTISGIPILELIHEDRLEQIIHRTAHGGGEIVNLLGYSSYYAPAAATALTVESILRDQRRLIPSAVLTHGEYGYNDLFIGLPAILGKNGVEAIVELNLTDKEKMKLQHSVESVKDVVNLLGY